MGSSWVGILVADWGAALARGLEAKNCLDGNGRRGTFKKHRDCWWWQISTDLRYRPGKAGKRERRRASCVYRPAILTVRDWNSGSSTFRQPCCPSMSRWPRVGFMPTD
jgi:hypothetical protein